MERGKAMSSSRKSMTCHQSDAIDSDYDAESKYNLPEGDLSEVILHYKEPEDASRKNSIPTASGSILGKREERPIVIDDGDEAYPSAKRMRSDVDFPARGPSTDASLPYIIAYCPRVLTLIHQLGLPLGVTFQLALLITLGKIKYSGITEERLSPLQGMDNASAAPLIHGIFCEGKSTSDLEQSHYGTYFSDEISTTAPWKELDREQAALKRGPYEGLGNNDSEPGWYGGKIEFRGHLKSQGKGKTKDKAHETHELVLDSCTLGTSSRFTRRFGSWSFLRIKIPQDLFHGKSNNLQTFFRKPFILWDKVFRACYAKRDNIFLYCTNETYPFSSAPKVPGRLSFEDFISWHNPIEYNKQQLMTKWSARTTLGFSNSIPGPRILQENIEEIDDVASEKGSDMTDGCGSASKSIHRALLDQLSLTSMPSAFQFRLGGYKGMLLMDELRLKENQSEEHHVSVRPSQTKIRYPVGMPHDPAMLTIDLLRISRLTTPSSISADIIINLAENGVPPIEFVNLFKSFVREIFHGLTTWEGPNAMYNLWVNVERAENVLAARRTREAAGEARARGYTNRSPEDAEPDHNDNDDDNDSSDNSGGNSVPKSVSWWPDHISGCPSSLAETVMVLLDSGFRPQECPMLRDKLKRLLSTKIESKLQKIRFEVAQSCLAFAVPDPYGVLGENEVQIKSSRRNLLGQDGLLTDIIIADVLIGRNPCKVPSDVRKVKAVEHPDLRNFVDVIVFSVKGYRRLIDFLAGGDYDGDIVQVIFSASIVEYFKNADEKFSLDPPGLDVAFTRDTETGSLFLDRTKDMGSQEKIHAMQQYLLGALVDPSLLGQYTALHTNATYHLGYGNPRTHEIAARCVRILDSDKTGYRIKQERVRGDMKEYKHNACPQWYAASKEKKKKMFKPRYDPSINNTYLQRKLSSPHVKGEFIMDRLRREADAEKERIMIQRDIIFAPLNNQPDADLIAPWDAAVIWAERPSGNKESTKAKKKALGLIATHVHGIYGMHKHIFRQRDTGGSFTDQPIDRRQDQLRKLSQEFASKPLLEDVPDIPDQATLDRWRASYAYKYDAEQNLKNGEQGWSRFPWNVALRELCVIKARSLGPYKVVANNFYERFKLVAPR